MSYGRNFGFRKLPNHGQRSGRYVVPSTGNRLPIGTPVKLDTTPPDENALSLTYVELATGAQAPVTGCGIVLYEYAPAAFAGDDPNLVTYSDKDTVPLGAAVQVVSGRDVKVVLTNTQDTTVSADFTGAYGTQRIMVAGLGATPTVVVGDYLTPGTGNDTDGYWAETGSAANGWLRVVSVDLDRHEVEAEFCF